MPITEELLKEYGVDNFDELEKNEDGSFKEKSALDRLFAHAQDMKSKDPDFIKGVKDTGIKEGSAIANKRIFKVFRTKFNLEFSNADIDQIEPEALADMVSSLKNANSTDDIKKLQDDLMKIANEKKDLEDNFSSKVKEIETKFAEESRIQKQKESISKLFRNPDKKFVVSEDVARMIFESKLKEDGFTIKYEQGLPVVYKGENHALTDNKTTVATLEYLADKYWSDILQRSNGSGGGNGGGNQRPANQDIVLSDKFKDLQAKFTGKRGG